MSLPPSFAKPGVALILPEAETGLNPHGLYDVDSACTRTAIESQGYPFRIVDPRDSGALAETLASPEFPILLTVRSQCALWPLPPADSAAGQATRNKVVVTLIGNPPYYEGSARFHEAAFRHVLAMCADHDTLDYAESLNTSGALLLPYRPAYHAASLDEEAARAPASQRPIPILFAASYWPPEIFRERWQTLFRAYPNVLRVMEATAELVTQDVSLPVISALKRTLGKAKLKFDLTSKGAMMALELLTRFAHLRAREAALLSVLKRPSLVITTALPKNAVIHSQCRLIKEAPFSQLLSLMHQSRCIVAQNPNHMTGAISERVTNSMRRGCVVVNSPNNAMRRLDGKSAILLGKRGDGLDEWLDRAISADREFDEIGESARQTAEMEFRMDHAFAFVLEQAEALRSGQALTP